MSTKTYDKKTAAFAGFLIQNIPASLDEKTMDGWMQNPSRLKNILSRLALPPERFSVVGQVSHGGAEAVRSADCCVGEAWGFRCGTLDSYLPDFQQDTEACRIGVVKRVDDLIPWTSLDVVQDVLGVTTDDPYTLGNLIIERGHTLTYKQVNDLVEEGALEADGKRYYFFVKSNLVNEPVLAGAVEFRNGSDVSRLDVGWSADIYGFFNGVSDHTCRFLLGSPDALKL